MGLEISKGSDKLQGIVEKYKEIYHMEPTDTDLFFLESIYE